MGYDARKKEVFEELEKLDHEPAVKDSIRAVLNSYFSQRDGRLENLLEVLEPGDESCHSEWIGKARESAAAAQDALGRSEHGKLWLAKISNEEHTFFFKLMLSQVPVKRDLMVQQTADLQKAEKEFEEKWRKIRDSDKELESRMLRIATEYDEILVSAAQVAAMTEKESREKMADTAKKVITLGLGVVDLGIIEQILKGAASLIGMKVDQTAARKLEIQALISREEGIFATFAEAREMVKEFLEDTSYPRVKDAYDDAEDAAEGLAGQMLTSGQKDDANVLGSAIKNELSKVFRVAEDAYKAFAKTHEYLFFGPLGASYYQELMEDDTWKAHSSRWKDAKHDIDDLLRERTLETNENKVLEVSLDGLSSDDQYIIYSRLKGSCEELLRTWNKFKEMTNEPEWAIESREQLKRILDAMR